MLRIFVFGGLRLELNGVPLDGAAARRRPLALLAILAEAGHAGVGRERLTTLLWPESDIERARNTLKQTVFTLRRELGELIVGGADLRLDPSMCTCDLWDFRNALDAREPEVAISLWRGPFLEGFHLDVVEFSHWSDSHTSRLSSDFNRALLATANNARNRGDLAVAVDALKRRAALEPYDSKVAGDLVEALVQAGDVGGAIRHANAHDALLRTEFGIVPDPPLRTLVDRLAPAVRLPTSAPNFVGKEDEAPLPQRLETVSAVAAPVPMPVRHSTRKQQLLTAGSILAAICLLVVVLNWREPWTRRAPVPTGRVMVLVAPFHTTGADSSLGYLREGLLDLVSSGLSTAEAVQTIDARTVLAALPRESEATTDNVLRLARRMSATFTVQGAVLEQAGQLQLTAVLRDSIGRTVNPITRAGPKDSLPALVDGLVAEILSSVAGEPTRSRMRLARHPVRAIRAFVDGQAAYRQGRWPEAISAYRVALEHDSTFVLAALGLVSSANWTGNREARFQGQSLAWNARSELAVADRFYLEALLGTDYPNRTSKEVRLTGWERASRYAGDRAEVWFALGDEYFHNGALVGRDRPMERAAAAFERALTIQPEYWAPLEHLVQIRALQGDVQRLLALKLRVQAYSAIDSQVFASWRIAEATADRRTLDSLRPHIHVDSDESLRAIALTGMYEGVTHQDVELALTVMLNRAVTAAEKRNGLLGQHAFALLIGKPVVAAQELVALAQLDAMSSEADRFAIADALYSGGVRSRAERAAGSLATAQEQSRSATSHIDRCTLEQWKLASADTLSVRTAIAKLRAPQGNVGDETIEEARVCSVLLEATLAVIGKGHKGRAAVVALDSTLALGPEIRNMTHYAPLALARLYARVGDTTSALKAVQRRGWFGRWPHYYAAHLEFELQLAAAMGAEAHRASVSRRLQLVRRGR